MDDDYKKLCLEISQKVIEDAERERRKKERYENRFNYISIIIAIATLLVSIIATVSA